MLHTCSRFSNLLRRLPLLVAALVAAATLGACQQQAKWQLSNVTHIVEPLKFSLESTNGGTETAADLRGKIVLVYFGYTHCPDVCPTTLAELAGVIRKLGDKARDVRVLFITVDPARDTLPVLKTYVAAFDKDHFIGLRGTSAQTTALAKRYRVGYGYEKPEANGDYIVNHSSAVFIFGPDGNARLLGTGANTPAEYEADLKRLINAG
ncbi:MAG: SCO family protein [Nevskiaceae bacterium]|nr:MAG: SCO family protein [Nevskiaceae bacterium]TBR72095.1 MAG: SCO family protein [Nevskiaceae bacterium]